MKHKTLSSRGAAEILSVSQQTVLKWLKKGDLKAIKLPGSGYYRIEQLDLIDFMEQRGWVVSEDLRNYVPACLGDRRCGEINRLLDSLPPHRRQRAYNSMVPYLKGLLVAL